MNFFAFGPIAAALDVAYAAVVNLALLLEPVFPVAASAAAIVLITLLVRAALIRVGVSQARAEVARRRLAPRISQLRAAHAKNPERMQRELVALYAAEKTSPFAGFLPLLIQLPIVSLVYGLFTQPQINGHANSLLADTIFGIPLGTSMVSTFGAGAGVSEVVLFGAMLGLIALVATLSRQFLAPLAASAGSGSPAGLAAGNPAGSPGGAALPGMGSLGRILSFLPYLTVFFAASVPLAAAIYLTVTTVWSFAERLILRRRMAG